MAAGQGGTKRRKATSAAPPESPESPDASDYRAGSETPSTGKASGLDADEKRRRFLERNRIAASKCRQKKKQWIEELEQSAAEAANRNKQLMGLVAQLREELVMLKNQAQAHAACERVGQYLQTNPL